MSFNGIVSGVILKHAIMFMYKQALNNPINGSSCTWHLYTSSCLKIYIDYLYCKNKTRKKHSYFGTNAVLVKLLKNALVL